MRYCGGKDFLVDVKDGLGIRAPKTPTDTRPRQVMSNLAGLKSPPQLPQKVTRPRSSSTSMSSPPSSTRKRTSSGVFQVDESEPLPKKAEISRSLSDSPRKRAEAAPNGRQKTTDKEKCGNQEKSLDKKKENVVLKKDKIIKQFDGEAKSNCVAAFKESDSWD